MSNLDSPDFNEPLKLDKNAKKEEKTFSPEIIAMVTSMGFTDKQSKKALSGKSAQIFHFFESSADKSLKRFFENECRLFTEI